MRLAFFRSQRSRVLPVVMTAVLAACSGPVSPPMGIDDETMVSSIPPGGDRDKTATYVTPADPADSSDNSDYLDTPNLAAKEDPRDTIDPAATARLDEEPIRQTTIPNDGVDMDQALGVEQPVSLAEDQARDIAEGQTTQPVVDGIGTDSLSERQPTPRRRTQIVDFQDATEADQITLPTRRRNVEQETQVAFLPRTEDPAREAPVLSEMSAAERACRRDLEKMGVRFEPLPPISNGRACGIAHPIKVSGLQGDIRLKPAATLNCQMTRLFAKWVKNELVPSARYRYFSGIQTIHQMSSYSCRKMNSRSRNPWSEHARGNALDIGGFTLKNGKHIDVRRKSFFSFREKGLLKTVREDSCKYFTTVLGPGDAYHGDHFHFDLRSRKSGYRHCSL
ncbi:MAG: extensin family protein [Rhizobiaceae bacterium]|nr:extensin family protein [Rhizobiaceae bacterium]